jgi:hypothetical protein
VHRSPIARIHPFARAHRASAQRTERMRPVVRDLYKQILVVGRAYPAGLDAVRDRAKREFRERAGLRSEADIRKAVGYGRYMLREMRALIQLKKYRTLKAKGYGAPAQR